MRTKAGDSEAAFDVIVSDQFQDFVERMAKARWITGRAIVTPEIVELHWTEAGKRQIRKLAKHIRPFEERFIRGSPRPVSKWAYLKLRLALALHAGELWFKGFRPISEDQFRALVILIASEAHKLRERGEL